MSVISQFFPSGDGSGGGGSKMDLEVLILSGGGGAAASCAPLLGACRHSGLGGGGAVFVGSVPVSRGCTVPVVVGGGGAGVTAPQPCTTNTSGARGGCSSITTPEGTLCVAGGGAGGHAGLCGIGFLCPTLNPVANRVYHGGTGGTGGFNFIVGCSTLYTLTGYSGTIDTCIVEGGKPFYSTGQYITDNTYCQLNPSNTGCAIERFASNNFCGPGQMNHKYGTFMGGAATGGASLRFTSPTCTDCFFNGRASGGAGGHANTTRGITLDCSCITRAGKGYCSDITGTLEEYGRGVVHITPTCSPCFPEWSSGDANSGRGGSVLCGTSGCICSGSGGSGVVVIRYPDQFPAAPASPGATDCSPATPGYYTYRFNSTGSITLP